MATRITSSAGMDWLRKWARGLSKNSNSVGTYDLLAESHRASICTLIADPSVLRRLSVAYGGAEARHGQVAASAAVKTFLVDASWTCHWALSVARTAPPSEATPSRSEAVGELRTLAGEVRTLAKSLRNASPDLGRATDIDYLRNRLQAGNPNGFIVKRKGWHTALPRADITVDMYLDALAADILEEAELRQVAIDARRQVGGKLAPYYPVIDMMTICSGRLSSPPDFGLIADVINALIQPNPHIDPDPIRKRYRAKQQRKLTPEGH